MIEDVRLAKTVILVKPVNLQIQQDRETNVSVLINISMMVKMINVSNAYLLVKNVLMIMNVRNVSYLILQDKDLYVNVLLNIMMIK